MADAIQILHVDDEPDFADMSARFLEREDDRFAVETVINASEGLDRLADDDFDCVVSDYQMPGMNGIEFLEAVREVSPDLPFILFAGEGSEEVAGDAISAGVTDYLRKETGSSQYELLANRIENAVEQRRSRTTATETEKRLHTIAEHSNDILWLFTDDWNELLFINSPYEEIWGQSTAELREDPQSFLMGIHPDDRSQVKAGMEQLSAGESIDIEYRVNADEEFGRWVWVQGEPVLADSGEVEKVVGFARDVTERKERERELERREAFLEQSRDVITVVDADGTVQFQSASTEQTTGFSPEQVMGQEGLEFVHPEDREKVTSLLTALVAESEPEATVELRVESADGSWRWVEARGVNKLGDPLIEGIIVSSRDITERKERERELQASEERYRRLVETAPTPIFVYSIDQELIYANEDAIDFLGADDASDILGSSVGDFTHPESQADVERRGQRLIEDQEPVPPIEEKLVDADGNIKQAILASSPVTYEGEPAIQTVATDITDQKERQRTLERLVGRTGQLLQKADKKGTAEVAVEIARDVLDAPLAGVHLLSDDGERLEAAAAMDEVREEFGVQPTYGRTDDQAVSELVWEAFEQGEVLYIEDTEEYGTLAEETPTRSGIVQPLDDHGVFIISTTEPDAFDETDRNVITLAAQTLTAALDQVEQTQELEHQSERLETFASVLSHDLRNPLRVAEGRLELATEECDSEHLEAVAQAHTRMETLIDDTLSLARAGETIGETDTVYLPELIDACWRNVETGEATIITDTDASIAADRTRLQQLCENLLRNAVEHGGADVTVTVGELPDGLYIEDDGPGIPEDEREEVFEAGYSTSDEGTGFGLNIVQEIAEAHDWEIRVTDGEDGGARFEITGIEFADC